MSPFIAFDHNKTTSKHGFPVILEHRRLSPALAHYSRRHLLQELRVCYVKKWLYSQPVNEHLPCKNVANKHVKFILIWMISPFSCKPCIRIQHRVKRIGWRDTALAKFSKFIAHYEIMCVRLSVYWKETLQSPILQKSIMNNHNQTNGQLLYIRMLDSP